MHTGVSSSGVGWQVCLERYTRVLMKASLEFPNHFLKIYSKTDEKDAYSVFDLRQPGKFFLPVERDPALQAAYRLRQRHMALTKPGSQLRHQLRAALHLAFPELTLLVQALTHPTALRF